MVLTCRKKSQTGIEDNEMDIMLGVLCTSPDFTNIFLSHAEFFEPDN